MPAEIEIIENQETQLNIKITKGAKVAGTFQLQQKETPALRNENVALSGIVVELKNDFEQFRITTGENGRFSFPVVRPGKWTLKIYTNSLPSGFEIKTAVFEFDLNPGEEQNLLIELQAKKRTIIFKSSQNLMMTPQSHAPDKPEKQKLKSDNLSGPDAEFYSVQIGAFRKKLPEDSPFFKNEQFVFTIQIDNFHKYFIGKYAIYEEAEEQKRRLDGKFKNIFVVSIKNNTPIQVKKK